MIEMSIIIALVVFFLHECTREGMILEFIYYALYDLPSFLKKPLFDCPTCMCMWWGPSIIGVCILAGFTEITNNWAMLVSMFMAGGINAIVLGLINKQEKRKCNCRKNRLKLTDDETQ
jgi:hypothetical protein